MMNQEHLNILKQGVDTWNEWREEHPDIMPILFGANLSDSTLVESISEEPISSMHSSEELRSEEPTLAEPSSAEPTSGELT